MIFLKNVALCATVISTLVSFKALASQDACTELRLRFGAYDAQRFEDSEGTCWLSVHPHETNNLVYRSFLFVSDGTFMVFNSLDPEGHGVTDGARNFMIFPRNTTPMALESSDYAKVITATAGVEILLSQTESRVKGMNGGEIKEDPKVSPYNKGGIEIKNVSGLVLDGGWKNFGDPFSAPDRKSTFTDSKNNKCQISNRELFKYDSDGDNTFRFSDKELRDFLKRKCPQVVFNP